MNPITKGINYIDEWLAPLSRLTSDEQFKGEFLKELGAKEKTDPADKAKTTEKLNFILRGLDALRKKLGLDKSDIPNVSNIAALGMVLAELYKVWEAVDEMLNTCDYSGPEGEKPTAEEEEIAKSNARRALAKFLTQTLIWKKLPRVAIMFDALGIFSDESNEMNRALDLLLFPIFSGINAIPHLEGLVNPDSFRPLGDLKEDNLLRITKGSFLILSILFLFLEDKLRHVGSFRFNTGYELPPEKDVFPNASKIARRVLQMQFIPGELFSGDDGDYFSEDFKTPNSTDCFFTFATIPVFPAETEPGTLPEGYQYVLGLNLNPGKFGSDMGGFGIRFPSDITESLIWGHNTKFHSFGPGILSTDPLIEIQWLAKKEGDAGKEGKDENNEQNTTRGGDIFFRIHPKKKVVEGHEEMDAEISLEFHDFSISISGEGRDGFMQKILPEKAAAKVKASLSIVYSPLLNKWSVQGLDMNDGLLFLFNVAIKDFKALEIPTLYIGIKPSLKEDKSICGVALETSAMLKTKLGPFQMTIDRLGLLLSLDFSKKASANLGFADLSYDLKPPTAVGFVVNASVVTGGGVLSVDPDNHQYYGGGELKIKLEKYELTLKVIAIILTQLPDGKKGFSFLLMASIEFTPAIDTPFGFKLKGLGVIVALHRSMNLEAFQSAVRDDRFDMILFPDNPVGNAPTIVKAMNSLFPAAEGRYVFALMARIVWGTAKLVDLKLGLLIEVPSPVKIAVVGVIKVLVEKGGKQIVKLQVNFLVALDFGKKIFSIDAAIYESKFLIFDIRGELFVRYRWGADPAFLISVGGWHPDFQVPAGLNLPAKPQRLTIPLMEGEHASLILSCYLALTSNTFQAGFKIELKIKWSKFRLESVLSVDALFHFDPFYFVVDFEGKLRIFWGDSRLAGVTVKGKFSGTNPWRIRGTATFEIWIWDYDVDFDKSTGEEISEPSQDIEVLPLIEKAITDKGNWQSTLPDGVSTHIVLRNTEVDAEAQAGEADAIPFILADPLSRMEVMQQVIPLGIRIDKVGSQKVKGARKFDLAAEMEGGSDQEGRDLEDHFAPGMFINMEDAEKLTRKSFEPMKAGHSFTDTGSVSCGTSLISEFAYDDQFNDPLAPENTPENPPVSDVHFNIWLNNNSVAKSAGGRRTTTRKEIELCKSVSKTDPYILADATTGARVNEVEGQKSMTGAYYELWKFQKLNPLRKLNVVRESELIS
ncbi:MAG: DUF6603 domain-containing protein [Ferruginibacter sp.]